MDPAAGAAGDPYSRSLRRPKPHSIPDNLVALSGAIRAWNCSNPGRVLADIAGFAEESALRSPLGVTLHLFKPVMLQKEAGERA